MSGNDALKHRRSGSKISEQNDRTLEIVDIAAVTIVGRRGRLEQTVSRFLQGLRKVGVNGSLCWMRRLFKTAG